MVATKDAEVLAREPDCTRYRFSDGDGTALVTSYRIFPGIELSYNDIRMPALPPEAARGEAVLEIDHCRQGRAEWDLGGEFIYLAAGDLSVRSGVRERSSSFPLGRYSGITVAVDLTRAPKCLSCVLEDVAVDPSALVRRFCADRSCSVLRARPDVAHIFSELYTVPERIRRGYLKLKVLELLLCLNEIKLQDADVSACCLSRYQVEAARKAARYLAENVGRHVTLRELSGHVGMSQSALRACFMGVYGMSAHAFARSFKMERAARLLRQTDKSVMEIGGLLGYDNSSKFARAFRDIMGVSPREYRCRPDALEPKTARLERTDARP